MAMKEGISESPGTRAATPMCLTETYLVSVDLNSFKQMVEREKRNEQKSMIEFFRSLPYINHWTKTQLERLVRDFNYLHFQRN